MVKNTFCKNMFQTITWGASCAVLILPILAGYFMSLQNGAHLGWILLVFIASIILLFFVIGFYWIFQTIEIDHEGIRVKIFQKTVRTVIWTDVVSIEERTVMKNPAYVVNIRNQRHLNLDRRKKIFDAINLYSDNQIKFSK